MAQKKRTSGQAENDLSLLNRLQKRDQILFSLKSGALGCGDKIKPGKPFTSRSKHRNTDFDQSTHIETFKEPVWWLMKLHFSYVDLEAFMEHHPAWFRGDHPRWFYSNNLTIRKLWNNFMTLTIIMVKEELCWCNIWGLFHFLSLK